jgi:hypothetical protein
VKTMAPVRASTDFRTYPSTLMVPASCLSAALGNRTHRDTA